MIFFIADVGSIAHVGDAASVGPDRQNCLDDVRAAHQQIFKKLDGFEIELEDQPFVHQQFCTPEELINV